MCNTTGSRNVFIGRRAGYSNSTGNDNVFIGYNAGYYETESNKLRIANDANNDLIHGSFSSPRKIGLCGTFPAADTSFAVAGLGNTTTGYNLRLVGNSFYYQSSSRKIKEDIKPLINEDFYKILKAEPKSFIDKPTGERNIGYIAEEFDEIGLKNLVGYKDGEPESIKYELISLYLIEIIKNQQREINELRTKIEALQ